MKTITAHRSWWALWTMISTFWAIYFTANSITWIVKLPDDHALAAITTITASLGCAIALQILVLRFVDRYFAASQRGR